MTKIFETYDDLIHHSVLRLNTFCDTIKTPLSIEQYETEGNSLKIIIEELYLWIDDYYEQASSMYSRILKSGDIDDLLNDQAMQAEFKLDALNKIKNCYYNIWMFIHRYLLTNSLDYEYEKN